MKINIPELWIGQILRASVFLSVLIVLIAGGCYLIQHGQGPLSLETFQYNTNALTSVRKILHAALQGSPEGAVQLGLLILILAQVVRVALTAWVFLKNKEKILASASLFILMVLVYSLFF